MIISYLIRTQICNFSPVADARKLNFPSIFGADKPGDPFSMRKPLMSPWSSFAHTRNRSAMGCPDINNQDADSR